MSSLNDELLRRIEDLRVHGESKLPPERQLAEDLGVARGTLRKELAGLAESGIIELRPGRGGGAFISEESRPELAVPIGDPPFIVTRQLDEVIGVPTFLTDQGYTPSTRILSAEERPANRHERSALDLEKRARVVVLRRLRSANGVPLSLEEMALRADLFPDILKRELTSAYGLMREVYGVNVTKSLESIAVKAATSTAAYHLGVSAGSPLFELDRVSYDSDGRAVEVSRDLFRADLVRLTVVTGAIGSDREDAPAG